MRDAPHSRALRHHLTGGFKWKRKYPIPPRHRIPAYMHNSRGVFVTRNSRSREREYIEDRHALRSCRKRVENERVRATPGHTYKKCTKPECASVKGERRVSERKCWWATRKILKGERKTRMSVSRHFSRKIAASGAQRRTRPGEEDLVEISRRGKSINI